MKRTRPLQRRPLVSVVVPCRNEARYVPGTVASALAQEGVDLQVIVVDDASADATGALAANLAAEDPRISAVRHSRCHGAVASWNDGLSRATGHYVMLLLPGNELVPGALLRASAVMEANPRVGMVHGRSWVLDGPPQQYPRRDRTSWSVWQGRRWILGTCAHGRAVVHQPAVLMRTRAVLTTGAYNPELRRAAALEYWLRLAAVWDVGHINGVLQTRQARRTLMNPTMELVAEELKDRLCAFRVMEDARFPLPEQEKVRQLRRAHRALRDEACRLAIRGSSPSGAVEEIVELRKFVESLHGVPGNIRAANIMQAKIDRARRERTPLVQRDALRWLRVRFSGVHLRQRRSTEPAG